MSPNSPSAARPRRQQQAGVRLRPVHPGEILREEFMAPLHLTMNRLALDLRVPVTRVAEIVHERRGITPETALRLARYFNTTPQFWMNLQTRYDLAIVREKESAGIEREVQPRNMSPDASQRN
jgi:addiction module HigA family antidote